MSRPKFYSLQKFADLHNLSKERVRQLCHAGLIEPLPIQLISRGPNSPFLISHDAKIIGKLPVDK